jgi:hypothetical protein
MSIKPQAASMNPKEWDCKEVMRCIEGYPGIFSRGVCTRYETVTTCCKKSGMEPNQEMIQRCITSVKTDPR